jgi:hypothetical protein
MFVHEFSATRPPYRCVAPRTMAPTAVADAGIDAKACAEIE